MFYVEHTIEVFLHLNTGSLSGIISDFCLKIVILFPLYTSHGLQWTCQNAPFYVKNELWELCLFQVVPSCLLGKHEWISRALKWRLNEEQERGYLVTSGYFFCVNCKFVFWKWLFIARCPANFLSKNVQLRHGQNMDTSPSTFWMVWGKLKAEEAVDGNTGYLKTLYYFVHLEQYYLVMWGEF